MWGIVPAAGNGTRLQPLAFSKELLPVGSRFEGAIEHPRAVGEYLIERMIEGGADRICFVISPAKCDIMRYFGARVGSADIAYVVQPEPRGLCDAIFRALPFLEPTETVAVGLPDTIWFPVDGLRELGENELSFLLFPVQRPELFDAVTTEPGGRVTGIQVKDAAPRTSWIWGAFKMPVHVLRELHHLWCERDRRDEYIGTLVNAWLARGGQARGVRAGEAYVDVGTLHGYREALRLLGTEPDRAFVRARGAAIAPALDHTGGA